MAEHVKHPTTLAVGIAVEFAGVIEIVTHDGFGIEIRLLEPFARITPSLVLALVLREMRFDPDVFHESRETFIELDVASVFARDQVAEPLVAELMRDQRVLAGCEFGREPGMLEGAARVSGSAGILHAAGDEIINHGLRVFFPGIVDSKLLAEEVDHRGRAAIIDGDAIGTTLGGVIGYGYSVPGIFHFFEFSGHYSDEVGGAGK